MKVSAVVISVALIVLMSAGLFALRIGRSFERKMAGRKAPTKVQTQPDHPAPPLKSGVIGNLGRHFSRASWYGPGFYGKRLANGRVYIKTDTFVAHRSLPFGTKLRIMNLTNGRSVVATVEDRGPYVPDMPGRDLDLSYAAAGELGARDAGVIPVTYEIIRHASSAARGGPRRAQPQNAE